MEGVRRYGERRRYEGGGEEMWMWMWDVGCDGEEV